MIFPGFPGVLSFFQVFQVFQVEWEPWFYTHSLHLTQHPIDAMLQYDANANARANVDASVNGP